MIPLNDHIYHVCELKEVPDAIRSKIHPNASRLEKLLDRCKHWIILNPANPNRGVFFRSRYAVLQERNRHLFTPSYRFTIHPFSKFAQFREIVMTFVWSTNLFLEPVIGTFVLSERVKANLQDQKAKNYMLIESLECVLGGMAGLDIITNFFLGYAKKQTREVILEPRKIIKQYVLSYFIFDLIAFAYIIVSALLQYEDGASMKAYGIIRQLYVFRLARLSSLTHCFSSCLKLAKVRDSVVQCLNILFTTLFILHWWSCVLCIAPLMNIAFNWDESDSWTVEAKVTVIEDNPMGARYVRFLLVVMCHFYGASRTSFWSQNTLEVIILSFIIVCGVAYYTYATALVGQLFRTANISETKYDELITQVKQYARHKKLPVQLKNRLLLYYETKFQRKFFQENTILQSLSEHLRLEVTLYSCKHLIESVHVFQGLSKSAIGTLLSLLKQEIFLPGDKITSSSSDDRSELYYFVSYGTVAYVVVQRDNKNQTEMVEVMHLEDGDHFGESERNANANEATKVQYTIAVEPAEIYSMTGKKLLQCKEMFPRFATKIENNYQQRKDYIARFWHMRNEKTASNILKELRYGRILHYDKHF